MTQSDRPYGAGVMRLSGHKPGHAEGDSISMTTTPVEEPLTIERATDLARRGFQPIEIEVYAPDPDNPPYSKLMRRKSPNEIRKELDAVLGEYPEGGEEGLHVFAGLHYDCVNCPTDNLTCSQYQDHGRNGNERCWRHPSCTGFLSKAHAPWPEYSRVTVFSVRGGSEGDYTHVESQDNSGHSELILLAKTFSGRDASWKFARNVADLLGV